MKLRPRYYLLISTFYFLGIEKIIGGKFELGRYVELLQLDLIICLLFEICRYQRLRWLRLTKQDEETRK